MEFELNYWFFGTDSNDRKQIEDVEQERGAELSFSGPLHHRQILVSNDQILVSDR